MFSLTKKLLLLFIISFSSCYKATSIKDLEGIIDPSFTQAYITTDNITKQPSINLLFKPNIFSIPSNSNTNKYIISFSVKQSNFLNPSFYEHPNIFITLINLESIENPKLYLESVIIKNCTISCSSYITDIENSAGETLIVNNSSVYINRDSDDNFLHIVILLDPIHKGESWEAIHGFPGTQTGNYQILYPFYRVKFIT